MKFKIDGMMCQHCKARVEKSILAVPGVKSVEISLEKATADVAGEFLPSDIMTAVSALGYQITIL